jgi:hypothetical protein
MAKVKKEEEILDSVEEAVEEVIAEPVVEILAEVDALAGKPYEGKVIVKSYAKVIGGKEAIEVVLDDASTTIYQEELVK